MTVVLSELEELKDMDFNIEVTGFELPEIEDEEETQIEEDEIPDEVEKRCKPGDVWLLGNHRLICGDSTDVYTLERLTGGARHGSCLYRPAVRNEKGKRGGFKRQPQLRRPFGI
jgi:hypothetical protein